MEEAYKRVILATYSDFNVGVSSDAELVNLIEKNDPMVLFYPL